MDKATTLPNYAADVSKIIRRISIQASDYVTIDSKAFVDLSPGARVLGAAAVVYLVGALLGFWRLT